MNSILLMCQFWYCLLSWRKVAKFRAKIYSISDFWNREKCNICDISSWLGISKFNNGVFGFGFCKKGWYKNNCWKATIFIESRYISWYWWNVSDLIFFTKNWFQTLHVFIPSFIFRKSTKKGWMHIWNFLNELPEGRNMLKPWSVYNLIHETQWYFG